MARLRKAGRVWRDATARADAERILIGDAAASALTIDLPALFPSKALLEVELGAGRGDFIMARAMACPDRNFLAVELAASVARVFAARAGRRGLNNLRIIRADARTLVNLLLPDGSVGVYHIYFPDPWPKARHEKHRMVSPSMVAALARTLATAGLIHVASDVEPWARQMFSMLTAGGFSESPAEVPGARFSGFGRKYLAAGRPIFASSFRRPDLTE
ncbi:MAG: tRNA (guanosine(46)-N7)-methyltransferase TrmB [Candidatus Binataceae bacterium]|nr:tRNA (guanosine(46)-N7)-methyltransferase TrmB [Candidatus Binataceae bacterium]